MGVASHEFPFALQPEAISSIRKHITTLQQSSPSTPTLPPLIDRPADLDPQGGFASSASVWLAVAFFVLVTLIFLAGRLCALRFRRWGDEGGRFIWLIGTATDAVLVLLRLLPRAVSLIVILLVWCCVLSPFLSLYTLTPDAYRFLIQCVALLPNLSLLLMCVHDLALLFKGVPPSPRRPVEALALVLMVVVIYCVIYGSIADVLYLLSFPTIAMSASFDVVGHLDTAIHLRRDRAVHTHALLRSGRQEGGRLRRRAQRRSRGIPPWSISSRTAPLPHGSVAPSSYSPS